MARKSRFRNIRIALSIFKRMRGERNRVYVTALFHLAPPRMIKNTLVVYATAAKPRMKTRPAHGKQSEVRRTRNRLTSLTANRVRYGSLLRPES